MFNPQQIAALDRHVHCAVVANAGSGKTSVLVERFLRILLLEAVRLDQVVAITFTRAAAAEMRQRLHEQIHTLLSKPDKQAQYLEQVSAEVLESRLRSLSVQIGSARISTFHSFCAGLVRQYADVVGRSSDVRDADARLTEELCTEAVDTAIRGLLGPENINDPDLQELFDVMTPASVQDFVARLTRNSARRREFVSACSIPIHEMLRQRQDAALPLQIEVAADCSRRLAAHVRPFAISVPVLAGLISVLESLSERLNEGDATALVELSQCTAEWFTTKREIRQKMIPSSSKGCALPGPFPSDLIGGLQMMAAVWDSEVEDRQFRVARALARLADAAASAYAALKRQRNVIDFDDMIDDAMRLLAHDEVADSIRRSISYVMIDEFQDTDPTQYALLEHLVPALTGGGRSGPNVYVVGDDKQSIYGFRDADVRLFRRARRAIRRANESGSPEDTGIRPLSVSYRMHQSLVEQVNTICRSAFSSAAAPDDADEVSYDVAYLDLEAGIIRDPSQTLSSVRLVEVDGDALKGPAEFEAVAMQISSMLRGSDPAMVFDPETAERAPRPGDVAVLVPRNADKAAMADELRRLGIPFKVYGGRAFYSRPEVADVRAALTAAVDPLNDLATAVAMRSPLLRCRDEDIVAASLLRRASSLQDGLQTLATSDHASADVIAASAFFDRLRSMLSLHPVSRVIEPMLELCGWYDAVRHEPRAEQMMANIEKLISICADFEQAHSASIADVLDNLSEPDEDLESEEVVLRDDDAVHIMTIHGSKGLEFPIVALAGLKNAIRIPSVLMTRQLGPTIGMPDQRVDPVHVLTKVDQPLVLSHALNSFIIRRREEAQNRRLLYVALTRAKAHLVLAVPTPETVSKATGLLQILVDAIDHTDLRRTCAVPRQEAAESAINVVSKTSPLPTPNHHPIIAPPADFVTASALYRRRNGGSFTSAKRRRGASETSSSAYGSAVHAALAAAIRDGYEPGSDELTRCIVDVLAGCELDRRQALRAHDEVLAVLSHDTVRPRRDELASGVVEGTLHALHGSTVIEGILDVRLAAMDGVVEIWDWKTNAIRTVQQVVDLGENYATQMQTYAWLCAQAIPDCRQITTRLIFTKALLADLPTSQVVLTWDAASVTLPEF
jgi:ATP-dependent helicase/nuclease subunit A